MFSEQGVPLGKVLRGIHDAFDRKMFRELLVKAKSFPGQAQKIFLDINKDAYVLVDVSELMVLLGGRGKGGGGRPCLSIISLWPVVVCPR